MSQSHGINGGSTDGRSGAVFSVGEWSFCWCSFDHLKFYMHKNIFKTLKEGEKTRQHNRSPLKGDDMIMFFSKVISAAPKRPKVS